MPLVNQVNFSHFEPSVLFYSHFSFFAEAAHPSKSGGCFSANSTVMTSDGSRKRLSDLKIGDSVLTVNKEGTLEFSPVILFLDRHPRELRQFYVISTQSGHQLTLTPSHLIYASEFGDPEGFEAIYAKEIREGDFILVTTSRGTVKAERVVDIEMRPLTGVYAPLTSAGNLVVDNVVASCYAVIDNQAVAHAAFLPIRWWSAIFNQIPDDKEGIHWYANALYNLAEFVMPRHLMLP